MIAVTRDVSPAIARAELTHLQRVPIGYERAREQHEQYRALLTSLGCEVISLPGDAAYPDCVFIEDTAIVLDDMAVITRPGAASRRGEVAVVAEALTPLRKLVHITAPATLDGGDVLVLDDRIYVGRSERSNEEALAAAATHRPRSHPRRPPRRPASQDRHHPRLARHATREPRLG
jgi:dimethylargininase